MYMSALLTKLKTLTVCITTKCWKFLKVWSTRSPYMSPEMQDKKQELEPGIKQYTGSKSGKEYVMTLYYNLAFYSYMQSKS